MHPDLQLACSHVYAPCGIPFNALPEKEQAQYSAYHLTLGSLHANFRVAKATPKKTGHFVTIWKRIPNSTIAPYDLDDPIDLFVITIRDGTRVGQLVLNKHVMLKKGILSRHGTGGKRALRVYAPWVTTTSSTATDSQAWQSDYFLDLSNPKSIDLDRARLLYSF